MAALTKYQKFIKNHFLGVAPVKFDGTENISVALCTSAYVPDASAHTNLSHITNEVTGTGYARKQLTGIVPTETNGVFTFDAADVTWLQNASGFTNARYAIVFKSGADGANSPLIGYMDLGGDKGITGGDFSIQWAATGIFTVA